MAKFLLMVEDSDEGFVISHRFDPPLDEKTHPTCAQMLGTVVIRTLTDELDKWDEQVAAPSERVAPAVVPDPNEILELHTT